MAIFSRAWGLAQLEDRSRAYRTPLEAVKASYQSLHYALQQSNFTAATSADALLYYVMRRDLPYALHETELSGTRILVNRQYKPIGYPWDRFDRSFVVYEDYTGLHVQATEELLKQISAPGASFSWLFSDSRAPWRGRREARTYETRLFHLMGALEADEWQESAGKIDVK